MSAPLAAAAALSPASDPRRAGRLAAAEAAGRLGRGRVRGLLLMASGDHGVELEEVAQGARAQIPDATLLVVGAESCLTAQGDTLGDDGVLALALATPIEARIAPSLGALSKILGEGAGPPRPAVLLSNLLDADALARVACAGAPLVGGTLESGTPLLLVEPGREPRRGEAALLRFGGGLRMATLSVEGVERLTPFLAVGSSNGMLIETLGERSALEALEAATEGFEAPSQVALLRRPGEAEPEAESRAGVPGGLLHRLVGLDPGRGAIWIDPPLPARAQIAFGRASASLARREGARRLQILLQEIGGGFPIAALPFECSARARHPSGRPSLEFGPLRERFPALPIAGLRTGAQLVASGARSEIVSQTSTLGLLYLPS